jgi:prophage antirepressor-like protein
MEAIKIFENDRFGEVRVAGTNENPLFCLVDICKAVDIANSRNVKNRLDEDDVHLVDIIDSLGRTQQAVFVSEAGMYDAVLKSDSPKARPFSRWITHEVLPSIRKHGA